MKKSLLQKLFFLKVLISFCTAAMGTAQAPVIHIDSITQDSVKHELEPQTTEQAAIVYPNFVAPSYKPSLDSYSIADVPSPRGKGIVGYVSDPNDYLDASAEQRINEMLYVLEQKSTAEVAVVMLPSIGQEVPKDFAVNLFEKWGIGKADTDNGLLILTVMDQRRTEFEVGYGLEPILTDVVCYRIGSDEIVPYFKTGNYGAGMSLAVERVKQFLEDPAAIEEIYSNDIAYQDDGDFLEVLGLGLLILSPYLLICLILSLWYYGVAYDIERSKDDYYDKYHRLDKLKFRLLKYLFPLPMLFFAQMVKKRLKKYRYAPRYSKINGKLLQLKDEWTENQFLEVAQNLEEKLNSVRYDVWVANDQSDIMILEYEGPNGRKYSDCKECGYKTFGKTKSTVTSAPSYDHAGERIDYYECRNCNFQESKIIIIAAISRPTSSSSGSSFSSSSSSSSSSFGGGSSGGGGAGVSW